MNIPLPIMALFGNNPDAYHVLDQNPDGSSNTVLDTNDLALVLTEQGNLQLFLPNNLQIDDRGLALVEIYNALCRDKAGTVDKKGRSIPDNVPYQGFTTQHAEVMKSRCR